MTSWIKRHPISAVVGTILLLAVGGSSSSSVTEGRVHISVDRYLREHFSSDDDQALRASTRVTDIYYCQSALRSSGSLKRLSKRQRQSARRPSRGLVNHDYVVVALTATKSDGQPVNLFISAEKEGGGQGGGDPGIYINALTDDQYRSLHANKLASWDGFSILVPLDVLTRKLREADDPHYNVLINNCWYYAQAASKSLLLLLSEQPDVNHKQRQDFQRNAEEVQNSIVKVMTRLCLDRLPLTRLCLERVPLTLNKWILDWHRVQHQESFHLCGS